MAGLKKKEVEKANFYYTHGVWPIVGGAALFLLYAATSMPGLGWRDAPEFAVTTQTLGIAHPAGFPTFSLLTKCLTFLPFGGIPFRIVLAAAFFQVLALYLMFKMILALASWNQGEPGASSDPPIQMAAGIITLGFGLIPVMWTNATGIEVYGLNLLFLASILACALRWIDTGRDFWLYIGGLIYGLSAGNHATVVFFLPGLLLLVLVHARQHRFRLVLFLSFYFLVGFSVYLYLPIRAQAGPGFDYSHPTTWAQFLRHVTDRKDAGKHFQAVRGGVLFYQQAGYFLSQTIPTAFWFPGLPLAVIGVVRIWRRHWALVLTTATITLFNVLFFISWKDPVAFLPTWFISFLFMGVGLAVLFSKLSVAVKGSPRNFLWIGAICAIFLALVITVQYPKRNQSKDFLSTESFRRDFESLPPEAISVSFILYFHQNAYQNIFQLRPEVTLIELQDFTSPEIHHPITPDRFPLARVPSGEYSQFDGVDYLKRFLRANLDDRRDIFWEPNYLDYYFELHLKPALEMLFKFSFNPEKELSDADAQAAVDRLTNKIRLEIQDDGYKADLDLDAYYLDSVFNIGNYFRKKGRPEYGMALMKKIEGLLGPEGTDSLAINNQAGLDAKIGKFAMDMGRSKEAETRLRKAVALIPDYYFAWATLGQLLVQEKRPEEALAALNRAVEIDPHRPEAYFYLGEYYLSVGQREQARDNYRRALYIAQGSALADEIYKAYQKHFVKIGGAK